MAQSNSNVKAGSSGDMRTWSCTFTTAEGDYSLTFQHGMNYVAESRVTLDTGGINTPRPKISNSSGTCTATFEDTLGYSGSAFFRGK